VKGVSVVNVEDGLRVGLLGCGRISRRHIQAIGTNRGLRLTWACDIDREKAVQVADQSGARWTTRVADMRDCDVVVVATPSGLHPQHVVQAIAETQARYIVCEKPLSLRGCDAREVYSAAEKAGRTILPAYQNRYNPLVVYLKQLIDSGRLGRIFQFNVNVLWNRNDEYFRDGWHGTANLDGGVLFTQASHYVDMLLFFFGDVRHARGCTGRLKGKPVPDTASAVLEFANGTIGSINATIAVYRKNYITEATLVAERGTIRVDGTNLNTVAFWDVDGIAKPDRDFTIDHIYEKGHETMYRYLVEGRWEMFPSRDDVERGVALLETLSS
jgi:UDP-N-acetyl-2-amino-2-deoxyglucuronate dehydrogenase